MTIKTISIEALAHVTGGGNAPLGGDVNQQINTNWGGTQIINPPRLEISPYRFEQLRQNPSLRSGPPPWKPMPIR